MRGLWILNTLSRPAKVLWGIIECDGDDGVIAALSDGTRGAYVIEELLELRPFRERVKTKTVQTTRKKE